MKYAKYIIIPFFLLFIACGNSKKEQKEANTSSKKAENQQKDAEQTQKKTKLKTEKREYKSNDYTISYEVITEGGDAVKGKIDAVLLKALVYQNDKYKNLEAFEKSLKNKQYKISSSDCPNASREFSATIGQVGEVISITINDYSFECGVHGNGSTKVSHFHIQSGKEVSLRELLKDEKRFTQEVEKQFCKDNKLEKNNTAYASAGYEGFSGGFFLAKNYSFENDGIRFIYNPYEAGPYTLPPFDVKVSYDKVKSYLTEKNPLGI